MVEQVAKPLDDGKPHTESAAPIPIGVVDLIELPKDHFLLIFGNSKAGVPHLQGDAARVAPRRYQYPTLARVAQCILYQVGQHALEKERVAAGDSARRPEP